ncbi:MAG: hypothetical protein CM1200mP2_10900 [Planctomycetaceae bacterium]|nr:MAG: hypothetical protein CM1200mP2_10900 [Planctomycetaceae bacterium]
MSTAITRRSFLGSTAVATGSMLFSIRRWRPRPRPRVKLRKAVKYAWLPERGKC